MFSPQRNQTTYFYPQVKNPTTNRNPCKRNKWIFYSLIVGFLLLVLIPAIIMILYSIGDKGNIYINTKLEIGDALGFYGALLSSAGSITLGWVAIWQTHKANQMTETALSLQKAEQISALVPQSCIFRFYEVPLSRKGTEVGAQLSLIQKNQSSNLIVDFQIEFPEFLVCNPQNKFLVCNKEDNQSAFVKVGVSSSINSNVIDSSCKSKVDFFIPERNITNKTEFNFVDIIMNYTLNCTNVYGYKTKAKVKLNMRLSFDSSKNLFYGENIVINCYTIESLIPPK